MRSIVDAQRSSDGDVTRAWEERTRRWIEVLSAAILAAATMGTAWSAYQSALWSDKFSSHNTTSLAALVRVGKLTTLALQRTTLHVNLFVQWIAAVNKGDNKTADFLFARFPEPLGSAAAAWRAAGARPVADLPGSPFDMPAYSVAERVEADRWENVAVSEAAAAEHASEISNRYLLFTIIFASVLFFAGVSGKCHWNVMDMALLALGAVTLISGVTALAWLPRA
jgi:hypothetical protein